MTVPSDLARPDCAIIPPRGNIRTREYMQPRIPIGAIDRSPTSSLRQLLSGVRITGSAAASTAFQANFPLEYGPRVISPACRISPRDHSDVLYAPARRWGGTNSHTHVLYGCDIHRLPRPRLILTWISRSQSPRPLTLVRETDGGVFIPLSLALSGILGRARSLVINLTERRRRRRGNSLWCRLDYPLGIEIPFVHVPRYVQVYVPRRAGRWRRKQGGTRGDDDPP